MRTGMTSGMLTVIDIINMQETRPPRQEPVLLYLIRSGNFAELMWPGYAVTHKNLQIVLNTPKNPYLKQANPPPQFCCT